MTAKRFLSIAATMLLALVMALTATGCGKGGGEGEAKEEKPKLSGTLTLSGSTTVLPLAQEAAEMFMDENPEVTVNVQGGGSSVGISNVAEGVVDIGNASRGLKDEEEGKGLVEHKIALDIIAVIVHKDVPMDNLSKEQKELGGPDKAIVVVVRDEASGTREMFDEKALNKEKPLSGAIECSSNGIVRQTVSSTPYSIGYISLGYLDTSVKAVKYEGVEANKDNAVNKSYSLSRYLYMFTKGEASGLAKAFIDFVLSDRFQDEVVAKEYIPMNQV